MTNKTELLPCPFCGNDELTAEPETTYVMCHGCDADGPMTKPGGAITAWNTRASPAEDVRAVVDEPVAWRCGGITWSYRADAMNHAERFSLEVEPLYRHPQRPVVMPERRTSDGWLDLTSQDRGWNACLDEFERLNK